MGVNEAIMNQEAMSNGGGRSIYGTIKPSLPQDWSMNHIQGTYSSQDTFRMSHSMFMKKFVGAVVTIAIVLSILPTSRGALPGGDGAFSATNVMRVTNESKPLLLMRETPNYVLELSRRIIIHRHGYRTLDSTALHLYAKWDFVLEPDCPMVFRIQDPSPNSMYQWNLTKVPSRGRADEMGETQLAMGPFAMLYFSGVNDAYVLHLQEISNLTGVGAALAEYTMHGITKYVRREIRNLTDSDIKEYFQALHVVFTTSDIEGIAMYGSKFVGHERLVALHNDKYFRFHANLLFQTSHPAFQLLLEQSLHAVNPNVSTPYWDFMLDSSLGANWTSASVYQEEWFGTIKNHQEDNFRVQGRFHDVKHILDLDSKKFPDADHNPYDYLSASKDCNAQEHLQRSSQTCGFSSVQSFSSCHHVANCFHNYSTLYEWDKCLEDRVHANLHTMHAGMWDCETDWNAFATDESWVSVHLLSFLANEVVGAVQSSAFGKYLSCPTTCVNGSKWDACRCLPIGSTNITSIADIDHLSNATVYGYLEEFYKSIYESSYLGSHFLVYHPDNVWFPYTFRDVELRNSFKLNRLMLKTVMFPGKFGVMGSGAASNDPLFFVMHQVFDKMLQVLRLSPAYNMLNLTWDNAGYSSYGRAWNDKTPFKAALFEPTIGHQISPHEYLTNKQLWALLDPVGESLPYIYDSFTSWGNCAFDPMASPL